MLGVPLTALALKFGPADYFLMMMMGLIFAVALARGSVLKALAMVALGLLLSTIGSDLESGEQRLTSGSSPAKAGRGVEFATLAMGAIGFAEIMRNLETPRRATSSPAR